MKNRTEDDVKSKTHCRVTEVKATAAIQTGKEKLEQQQLTIYRTRKTASILPSGKQAFVINTRSIRGCEYGRDEEAHADFAPRKAV